VHNFFHRATAGRAACCLAGKNVDANRDAAPHRGKIKIGDVAETHILSALLRCAENFARKHANKIIFRAMSRRLHRAPRAQRWAAASIHKIKWSHCYFFSCVVIGM
jgi:hypothetical protein